MIAIIFIAHTNFGQNKILVTFKDKVKKDFNPLEYFHPKAIERRKIHGLPLVQETDFPVNPDYVEKVLELSDSSTIVSRWLNGVFIYCNAKAIDQIEKLPFVKNIYYAPPNSAKLKVSSYMDSLYLNPGKVQEQQLKIFGVEQFRNEGITGKGVRVAIFDVGFKGANINPALSHIFQNDKVAETFDFIKKKPFVYNYGTHGTTVMSCIGGKHEGKSVGMATDAEFILARTERSLWEPRSEEENWLAAAEWADKNGADVINSSLGYGKTRYFRKDMNGKFSIVSFAANMASHKGILICNSAGNEATDSWEKIITPADVDSVLTVGGIMPGEGIHTSFSSLGPTEDKRLKPNICAFGHVYAANVYGMHITQGTSFSSPLIAGFAACIKQLKPNWTNMEMKEEIEKSGHLYPYFDYAHGYGVPHSSYFFIGNNERKILNKDPFTLTRKNLPNGSTRIEVSLIDSIYNQYIPHYETQNTNEEDTLAISNVRVNEYYSNNPDWSIQKPYIYYHVLNKHGYLNNWYVLEIKNPRILEFQNTDLNEGDIVEIYFMGYVKTYKELWQE